MFSHRQAISESKGDKLPSSAKWRIWTQGLRHQVASRLNARCQTDWAIEDQAKNLNSTARPHDQRAFSPLDPTASWLLYLVLAIYMFVGVNFDALAQAIFNMGIPIMVRRHFYIETAPSRLTAGHTSGFFFTVLLLLLNIGIDYDTVCAVAVGTAIRHSTSCAGRCAAACGRAVRHNECCAGLQYQPRQRRPYKWSMSILPRSQFYKKQGKLAFSTSCTTVRPHRRLRNDAWRRDS